MTFESFCGNIKLRVSVNMDTKLLYFGCSGFMSNFTFLQVLFNNIETLA